MKFGPKAVLDDAEMIGMIAGIRENSRRYNPMNKNDIKKAAGLIAASKRKTKKFKNSLPSDTWSYNIMHKICKSEGLTVKRPSNMDKDRATAERKVEEIKMWYKNVREEIDKVCLEFSVSYEDLSDDHFNVLDETSLDPHVGKSKTKVVVEKHGVCRREVGSSRETATVLPAVTASGYKFPPLFIFKGKKKINFGGFMAGIDDESFKKSIKITVNENAYMSTTIFREYVSHFVEFMPKFTDDGKPITFRFLFYDQHITHMDDEVLKLFRRNNIFVFGTIPHLTQLTHAG